MDTHNRPDEWKIEQGLSAAKLPILDQSGPHVVAIHPRKSDEGDYASSLKEVDHDEGGDRNVMFAREREGWKGFVSIPTYLSIYYLLPV